MEGQQGLVRRIEVPAEPGSAGPKSTTPRLIVKIKMPTDPSKASPASTPSGAQPSPGASPAPSRPEAPKPKEEPAIWRRPERFHDSSSSSDSDSDDGGGSGGGGGEGRGGKPAPFNNQPLRSPPPAQEETWQPNRPPQPPKKRSLPSPTGGPKKAKPTTPGAGGGGALGFGGPGGIPLASLPPGSIPSFGRPVYDQEVCWGKLGSFPWWPCQVNLEPNEAGRRAKHGPTDTFVAFYGTGDVAWLPMDKIKPFSHEFSKKAAVKNKQLQKSVQEAKDHILSSGGELPTT